MKLPALLFTALVLSAIPGHAQNCGLDCSTDESCANCHWRGNYCNGNGQPDYCANCFPCATLSATEAKKRKPLYSSSARLNDAGEIWKLMTDHLASMQPISRSAQALKLPIGHPAIKKTTLDLSACRIKLALIR